ncbi:MAG TPA: DUF6370 family protein [Tepidisphaeraceae bacterium]|jgi:hypothetical protein|nr:DUF6370 family protein [Tepidisphaeraceae bacterium]
MKFVAFALCAMICVAITASFTRAADAAKEVTLKGKATCAKCDLKKTTKCQDALVVTDNGKEVVYYIKMDEKGKAFHKDICQAAKDNVTVTGVVSEKDGQKWITASKIEG